MARAHGGGAGTGWTQRPRRALWRAACHPLTLPIWLGLGAWSLVTLFEQRDVGNVTPKSISRLAEELVAPDAGSVRMTLWNYDLYAVSEGDGYRIIDTNFESADELSRLWQQQPERMVQVEVVLAQEFSGALAHTRRHVLDHVRATPFTERTLSADESAAIRRGAVDHLLRDHPDVVSEPYAGRLAHVRAGDVDAVSTVWSGYGVNLGVIAGSAMSAFVLARTGMSLRRLLGRLKARRRGRRGMCPACGYPLNGLATGACPECGAAIAPSA